MAARTAITVTPVTRDGVLDIDATGLRTLSIPADDHTLNNNGRTFLYVKNTSLGTLSVTIPAQDGESDDIVVSLLTLDHILIGPITRSKYNVFGTSHCLVNVNGIASDLALAGFRF